MIDRLPHIPIPIPIPIPDQMSVMMERQSKSDEHQQDETLQWGEDDAAYDEQEADGAENGWDQEMGSEGAF